MNEHRPSNPPSADHEEFLILAERSLRGEITENERARLAEHVAACEPCREYVKHIQQEQDIMDAVINKVHRNCDFERIEQAIANRRLLERFQDRFCLTFLISAGVAGGIAWWLGAPDGAVTAFLSFAGGTALYWLYRRRLMERWGELAEQCKRGDPAAFERFHHSARSHLTWERIGVFTLVIWMAVFAVVWLAQGRWLMGLWAATMALVIVAFMWWGYRTSARKREEAFVTGEIDSDEYFIGRQTQRRAIRFLRFLKRFTRGSGER